MVKNLPANAGKMDSLGWEDALEKKMTTHCSNLAWDSQGKNTGVGCHLKERYNQIAIQ